MERLLIVGTGDVARRALPSLVARYRALALVRGEDARSAIEALGARVAIGDLDRPETLAPFAGCADAVLHLAPPDEMQRGDARTRRLISALSGAAMVPRRVVYISTSGVYGDCGGARVDESRPVNPGTERGARRVDAERAMTEWGERAGVKVTILRVPGIYAADRL